MLKVHDGFGLDLQTLKEFVDNCYNKFPKNTPIKFQNDTLLSDAVDIKLGLADSDSICFYSTI